MLHDYRYISKHDPKVQAAYEDLMQLLREVHKELKNHYTFQQKMVGSYARNMITYDEKSNVGFDFDVNIIPNDDNEFEAKEIKMLFKHALDNHVKSHCFDFAEDSTRVLTIKVKDQKNSKVIYSVDFAFVNDYEDEEGEHQEYIHNNKKQGSYTWEDQPNGYYMLPDKVEWIKAHGLWDTVLRPYYIEKKNSNTDQHVHSRTIFSIAVHEVCQRYGFYE